MEKDQLTEDNKYRIEQLRLLWLTSVGIGGGIAGVLHSLLSPFVLVGVGGIILAILGLGMWRLDRRIRDTIARLKEISQ